MKEFVRRVLKSADAALSAADVPFLLDKYSLRGTARILVRDPLTVTTAPEKWAYALEFPRTGRIPGWGDRPILIRVHVTVQEGRIGIGCLERDGKTFIDESDSQATVSPEWVELYVRRPQHCVGVMIRNSSDGGVATQFSVHAIECVPLANSDARGAARRRRLEPVPDWSRYYGHRFELIDDKIRAQYFDDFREPFVIPWLDDLKLRIYPCNQMSRAVYISGLYEPNTMLALSRLLHPGQVMLDLGAGMGFFAVFAARILAARGRVFAFEPSARDYGRLEENIRLNELNNIEIIRAAITDSMGNATILIASDEHSGHNTLAGRFGYSNVASSATEHVPTVTLDSFVAEQRLEQVDVIKMDIEGGEYRALLGAGKTLEEFRPALIVEIAPNALEAAGVAVEDIERLMAERRYSFYAIHEETAELVPMPSLETDRSVNVVCLPSERARPR